MTTTIAIIQARMNSTRLPGKVLAELGGRSMLGQVVFRVRLAETVDRVVVATGAGQADDPIERECRRLDVACFRGSQQDVLDRYHQAAAMHGADVIVRITADCPLADPAVIDHVVRAMLARRPDYASNTLTRTWPRGLDTEVFTAAALERAWREASEPYERTHVTPYFYQHPDRFHLLAVTNGEDHSRHRWTVDTPEDLAFARAIYARLDAAMDSPRSTSWHDVLGLVTEEPALAEMNRDVRQKSLVEG